ncbi:exopolysaccharide biosynthesis protein [Luteolibacter luteus]|uniref:Exopolysaccharide biosynthesis protein n=2 Tax=Luteolibacter luteus TaxID=2728835 RepID=A0A858RR47_9BACT|nr:exopolysaccharide biosynthesis protein [Luteolibacter luteus]
MLDRFGKLAEEQEKVPVEDLMDAVGRRSFGPLLLMAGIVMAAPGISDIPGVPTITGIFVLIVCVQILFGREDFWLPGWLLKRKIPQKLLGKLASNKWSRRVAKAVDRFVTERLEFLTGPKANYVVAAVCTALAVMSPLTELVPLSGIGVGVALVSFGISLIARDGLMALIGFVLSAGTIGLAVAAKL